MRIFCKIFGHEWCYNTSIYTCYRCSRCLKEKPIAAIQKAEPNNRGEKIE